MIEIAKLAVAEALKHGAQYAEARLVRLVRQDLVLKNGALDGAESTEEFGCGVRVLVDGCWGFQAMPLWADHGPAEQNARALGRRAPVVAKALASACTKRVELAPEPPQQGSYSTPLVEDPFAVKLSEKLELLRGCDAALQGRAETVVREASLSARAEEKWFASSEGAEQHQKLVRVGAGLSSTAAANGTVERRSYPASFGGNYKAGGFEHVRAWKLAEAGPRVRDEAVELCSAPLCPPGRRDLLLMGSQLALQIHESVGHPSEIDRVFGHELDLAGSSFATADKLGNFRYGSAIVNLEADSTLPGGLDTRGWDDEGVASGKWRIVDQGVLKGYLTSREWAARIGEARSRGSARAEGWANFPIVRITNLSLLPGTWELDALIADTQDGVLCDTVKTWSIDQHRLNFQFTTEIGWEIKNGVKGRMLRRPTYQGRTPEFWASCDAICNASHFEVWGVPNCGKGNPMQVAEMSHGAAPARFRGMTFL
ncbi:MAG: TldD/PmbA family protein [Planctomycetes bacterium]|nr:TldD/PmbA family protein [Planctomycetota bacterium]